MTDLVKNIHRGEEYDVYIGRPSEWGNPYSHIGKASKFRLKYVCATREEAIAAYRQHLNDRIREEGQPLIDKLAELDGKRLGCFCAPAPCHGEVLVAAASWAKTQLETVA